MIVIAAEGRVTSSREVALRGVGLGGTCSHQRCRCCIGISCVNIPNVATAVDLPVPAATGN